MGNRNRKSDPTLPARIHIWMLASLLLVILPHTLRLPWWLSLFILGIGLYHLQAARNNAQRPPRFLVLALTLAGSGAVALHYHTLLGRNAGVALLVVMLALKLLEVRQLRDALLVIYISYFVVVTNFLFTQTPFIALYMFAVTVVITATLSVATHAGPIRSSASHLRLAATLLAQALPVMVVLFVFFPRIAGPIWGLPKDAHAGVTGLSETMSPGALSNLAQSDELAFRVEFLDPAPAPSLRYWRGPVMLHTDGKTWSKGRFAMRLESRGNAMQLEGEPVRYTVTLEAHNKRWLFGLDLPMKLSLPAFNTVDFQWLALKPVRERTRYEATSWPRYHTGPLSPHLRDAALQLPEDVSDRIRDLAHGWRDKAATDRDVVQQALEYFHTEPFVYTLSPPLLGDDPMDEFLFSTRRGFCEHYAAAFVMLMRSAGIPSRIVTGYQGGEYNPVGDYWAIRQSDAHAWAEAWLPGSGWERVDPTAAVAPERIEHALDLAEQASGAPARFQLAESSLLVRGWRNLRYSLDAINNTWNQWVLSYGAKRQLELLRTLGFDQPSWKDMALALFVLISALLLGIAVWMFARNPRTADPVTRAWQKFCERMSRIGIQRETSEGPRDFARRIIASHPELARQVNTITDLYIQLRYGKPVNPVNGAAQLQRLVHRFPRRTG